MRAKDQDVTDTLENVRLATENLNELTESVKERPWSLIRIRQPKDRKVPNDEDPMTTRIGGASACAVTLLMAGCGGKILYPHYYALDIPPAPGPAVSDARLPATLAVRRFETPPYLRQGRIVYRKAPAEIGFYDYHRWAADPAETVTAAVIDSLRSSRLFSFVKPYDGQGQQDYLMSGRLERLEEIDYGSSVRVEAKLSAELVDLRTGATVWTGDADETLGVETRNVNSVVVEMSQAIQENIARLVASLNQQLPAKSRGDEMSVENSTRPLPDGELSSGVPRLDITGSRGAARSVWPQRSRPAQTPFRGSRIPPPFPESAGAHLLIAALLSAFLGDATDAGIIAVIVLLSTALDFTQTHSRSERSSNCGNRWRPPPPCCATGSGRKSGEATLCPGMSYGCRPETWSRRMRAFWNRATSIFYKRH